ncbi:MAG: hypothetical protein WC108_01675 [Bacteroidales bacterium]
MNLYLNELAPWERKSEYYHSIQLGRDLNEQTKAIKSQSKAMIESQLSTANDIIASQDRIHEGIGLLYTGLENIELGIENLKSTFEWGISEILWQFEQNRTEMKNILNVLMEPLNYQAKERRKRAEEAFSNGWIEDAEFEFKESEKLNRYDFSIHISLGLIYLFHKINKKEALRYFENAIKYARPKSNYYTSFALLYKALIKFDIGDTIEAEKCSEEAIKISPDFTEAYYQNAQYNAQLHNYEKSILYLKHVITIQPLYCLKANNDPLFDSIRMYVNYMFNNHRISEGNKAKEKYGELLTIYKKLYSFLNEYKVKDFINDQLFENLKLQSKELKDMQKRIERNSYFDSYEINHTYAPLLQDKQRNICTTIEKDILRLIEQHKKGHAVIVDNINSQKENHYSNLSSLIDDSFTHLYWGSFIVPAIMILIIGEGSDKLLALLFLVPYLSQLLSIGLVWLSFFDSRYINDREVRIMAWSILIYLFLSICYYLFNRAQKKSHFSKFVFTQKKKIIAVENYENVLTSILKDFKNEFNFSSKN